jgi:hypothetical protein
MALLRTARLFAGYNPSEVGSTLLFTCPPGYRAVLRSMDISCATVVTQERIDVNLFTGGEDVFLFYRALLSVSEPNGQWRGHLVLDAGEQIFTQSAAVAFWATGSGALMPLQN